MNTMKRSLVRFGTLAALATVGACGAPATGAPAGGAAPVVTAYMTPTCGCCKHWVTHMREHGFTVNEVKRADLSSIRAENGVPGRAVSCHTAVVDGYALEGHVPAGAVRRLLAERPAVRGIAVPGMPIGSPGMEQLGTPWESYDVLAFDGQGRTSVFERRTGGDH